MSFDENYLQQILEEAIRQGVDTSNLEQVAQVMIDNEGAAVGDFEKPNTVSIGVTLPGCYVININEEGREGAKKNAYYILLADTLENVEIEPEFGRKISNSELELKVEKKYKMTDDEKKAHDAKSGANTQVRYNVRYDGETTVNSGTIIKIKPYDGTVQNAHGMPLEAQSWVTLRNLRRTERYDVASDRPNFTSWSVGETKNIEHDPSRTEKDLLPCLAKLSNYNKVVNVGNNNPDFGPHNRTVTEEEEIKSWVGDLKSWQKRIGILTQLPPEQRIIADKALVVSLQGTEMTPELTGRGESVVFDKPVWDKQFVHTKKDGSESWRQADLRMRGVVREGEKRTPVVVHIRISGDNNELYNCGIADKDTFANLAYYYIPHCDGYVIATLDVPSSHNMKESMKITNNHENDKYPMEVAYGCWYYSDVVKFMLVPGIVKGGYEIDYSGAEAAMIAKLGTSDLSEDPNPRILQLAQANKLNKVSKPDVINLMESTQNLETLKDTYRFFVVMDRDKQSQTMRELLEDVQNLVANPKKKAKNPPKTVEEAVSQLFQGNKFANIRGWPVFTGDINFTVFAIKKTVYDNYMNKRDEKIPPEEYVRRMKAAKEDYDLEQKNLQKKVQDHKNQAEVEDINRLAAAHPGMFDDEPAKRQKLDEDVEI